MLDPVPPASSPPEEQRQSRRAWALIAALIVIQFLLFRQHAIREILWAYPAHHDQVKFLHESQEIYFKMLDSGFWSGILFQLQHPLPSSFLLSLQGAVIFFLFGPQRFNALSLVFAYFALLQVTLAFCVRRLTGRWSLSFIAQGLLIGTMSRFFYAGGLSDFRADGPASSLYGVTLCCFLLSENLTNPRWSQLTAFSAALLCWNRPIAGVYLLGIALILWLIMVARIRRSEHDLSSRQLLRGTGKYGVMFAALTLPIPIIGARISYEYYVVGHFLTPENKIRALEQGVVTLTDNLRYYPDSLVRYHLGQPVIVLWVLLMAAAALFLGIGRLRYAGGLARSKASSVSLGMLAIWLVTPLAILTANLSKSPLVASVALTPAVLLATFLLCRVLQPWLTAASPRLASVSSTALAAISVLVGMTVMANAEVRPDVHSANVAPIKALMKAYDDVTAYCQYFGLKNPTFVTDRILEYFNGTAAAVVIFERSGLNIQPQEWLARNIYERPLEEVLRVTDSADCALLTLDPVEKTKASLFPFELTAAKWQDAYRKMVTTQMIPLARLSMPGHNFQIFVRPRVRVEGDSGGWLTADGAELLAPARVLRVWPIIRLSGSTIGSKHLRGSLGTTVTMAGGSGRTIPSRASIAADESYEIQVDASGIPLPDTGLVHLRLSFDRYFVPKALGINPDPRKLVIQFPKTAAMSPAPAIADRDGLMVPPLPPQLSAGDLYP